MKRSLIRFFGPLVLLLSIPFVYNSCQGGLLGSKGFTSAQSVSCKSGLEKGIVTKMEVDDNLAPGAFANKKVLLREDLDQKSVQAKASEPLDLAAGTSLGIIMNNACLQREHDNLDQYAITASILKTNTMMPDLNRQAYEWVLDRSYTDSEIEALAETEPCIEGVTWNRTYKIQATFNDTGYIYQTHLSAMRAPSAYDLFYSTTGGMKTSGTLSNATLVAVIDTGVDYQHPDLQNNMWAHTQGIGIDITTVGTSDAVSYYPYDASSVGHGTHVSGIIAAVSNNGQGIVGTMPYRARIMAIKVFKKDSSGNLTTTSQYFYNAVKFAYSNGAHVINLSLGAVGAGANSDSLAYAAVTEAVQHGSFVTVVIGNADNGANGQLIDGTTYSSIPGQYATLDGVMGVGSFDATTGNKSYFSHYSTTYAEIGAPGAEQGSTGIYSTVPTSLSSYGRLAGTSQAAPMVSAAAALTIGLIKEAYGTPPTPAEVERLIKASAIKSSALAGYFKDGNRLDLLSLVQKINTDYPVTKTGGSTTVGSACN